MTVKFADDSSYFWLANETIDCVTVNFVDVTVKCREMRYLAEVLCWIVKYLTIQDVFDLEKKYLADVNKYLTDVSNLNSMFKSWLFVLRINEKVFEKLCFTCSICFIVHSTWEQ